MATARRISKNIAALSFAELLSKILQFIIMVYAARLLDKESFGIFSFALAFSFIAVILADFGVNTLIIREIAREKSKAAKYFASAFLLKIILSAITFLLIFAVLNVLDYSTMSRAVVYLVWLFTMISSFTDLSYSIFRSFERMGYDAFIKILRMLILVSLTFFVLLNGYGIIFFSLAFVITEIIVFLISLIFVFSRFIRPSFELDVNFIKNLFLKSVPFGLSIIFGSIYFYIDSVMISKIRGNVEVANYSVAYNLVLALLFIPTIYTAAIYPVMSRYFNKNNNSLKFIYKKSFKYLYILGLPISFGIFLLADKIILFLYGPKYGTSVLALKIVAWFIFLKFINFLFGITLSSVNRQKQRMYSQGITAAFNVILNLALIPYFGFIGAAISTLITEVFLFFIYYYYNSKYFYYYNFIPEIFKPLIAAVAMAVFIIFTNLNLIFLIIVSAFVYFAVILILKTFDRSDVELLTKIIKNDTAQKIK